MSKYELAMSVKTVTKDELIEFLAVRAKTEVMEPPSSMYNLHNPAWVDGYKEAMNQAIVEACYLEETDSEPTLNENQQNWIRRLEANYTWYDKSAQHALYATMRDGDLLPELPKDEFAQVLQTYSQFITGQGEGVSE